jgi:hypothetical protein
MIAYILSDHLRRVNCEKGFAVTEIAAFAQRNFYLASTVVSGGLHCFTGIGNGVTVREDEIHR